MDRQTIYFGQVPLETDLLHAEQNTMVAIGELAQAVLGSTPAVSGLTVSVTAPTSLAVQITPGSLYEVEDLEATAWSSLSADTADTIVKQGILLEAVTIGITPPGTVGYSQCTLIEVQYADQDTQSTVLPFYNSNNPSQPFSGPGNSGSPSNTVRKGIVAYQAKTGTAAPTGSQVAPTPDAGWVGLAVVTAAYGNSSITTGQIVNYSSAPYIPATLPQVPDHVINGDWVYAPDTGTANNLVVNTSPPNTWGTSSPTLTVGTKIRTRVAYAPTGASVCNWNGTGNHSIINGATLAAITTGQWSAGSMLDLEYDGSNWQLTAPVPPGSGGSAGPTGPSGPTGPAGAAGPSGISTGALLRTSVYTNVGGTQYVSVNGGTATTTGAGTFTSLGGTNSVDVQVQAGGGSGAGTRNSSNSGPTAYACGGGAGGNYGRSVFTTGFSGGITITVGAGASGAASGQNAGNNGNTSSFGSLLSCSGGAGAPFPGGPFQSYGMSLAGEGAAGGTTGGITGANVLAIPGGPGQAGVVNTSVGCTTGVGLGGSGGDSFLGNGGMQANVGPFAPGSVTVQTGIAGTGYGAGSGGAATTDGGGSAGSAAGQPGIVIVREYE